MLNCGGLVDFLSRHSSGIAVVRRDSSWVQLKSLRDLTFEGCPVDVEVVKMAEVESNVLISYRQK